jgi:hypothetical protein
MSKKKKTPLGPTKGDLEKKGLVPPKPPAKPPKKK